MFYPVESLRRGGRFYLCWVADSWPLRFATITHRQLWSQDIRQICDDLLEVMKNESGRPKKRFSLRLSSQLMRGLVRLYQRKVTVFVGDLCMINALVMKSTNKKLTHDTNDRVIILRHPEIPRLVFEEHVDDDKIEERIKNSGNVAQVQDITLKEPTLPENRLLIDDGFGELHPDQPLQMLADRTLEMMLVQETSAVHHSALELPDLSTNKSHDRSRLAAHESAQMERISEHDVSMFRKSIGEELIPGFEKEVPEIQEIPEIPLPDLPAPQTENQAKSSQVIDQVPETLGLDSPKTRLITEDVKEKSPLELILEELEEPQVKRRKLRNKLIIDKKTKLSSNFIRSRIQNINVDLRCEDSTYDIISIYATPYTLLNRAAHCGHSLHSNLGYQLAHMFSRNLGIVPRQPEDRDIEEVILARTRQSRMRSILEKIDEEVEPADKRTESIQHQVQDISKDMSVTDQNKMDVTEPNIQDVQVQVQEIMDIYDLPTQRILTVSEAQRRASDGPLPKRPRRSGYVSYRLSQQFQETSNIEANKENIPGLENRSQGEEHITALLVEAGLADVPEQERPTDIEPTYLRSTQKSKRNGSETSETPLGSLDRTKVSLGDSERTTDSKRFIREEWGTHGTMHKIYKCIKEGVKPLNVRYLVTEGPVISGHQRLIAARCFTSILKLKQHGFIKISKDSNTYEIKDITLGNKITH